MAPPKDYEAEEISVIVDGERVADLDAVGFDQAREHERDKTIGDDGNVYIIVSGDYEGTVAVKATSPSIPRLQTLFEEATTFTLALKYAPTEPFSESSLIGAKLTNFAPSDDYDGESMPMWEGSFMADSVEHVEA